MPEVVPIGAVARHALPEVAPTPPGGVPRHVLPQPPAVLLRGPADRRILAGGAVAVGLVAGLALLVGPLPAWCTAIAIAIRLVGGGQYAVAVARRRACPNLVTWFLWGLTPMIAVAAQATGSPGPEVVVTFVLGLSPLVVTAVGLCTDRSASRLTPFTRGCAAASVLGIVLWQVTAEPAVAIACCIVADLLATLPTLQKALRDPESEYAPPYLLSVLAMTVTLGTVTHGDFTAYGFPLYMLSINVLLFTVAAFPLARILDWRSRRTLPRDRRARRLRAGRHATPRRLRDGALPVPR